MGGVISSHLQIVGQSCFHNYDITLIMLVAKLLTSCLSSV